MRIRVDSDGGLSAPRRPRTLDARFLPYPPWVTGLTVPVSPCMQMVGHAPPVCICLFVHFSGPGLNQTVDRCPAPPRERPPAAAVSARLHLLASRDRRPAHGLGSRSSVARRPSVDSVHLAQRPAFQSPRGVDRRSCPTLTANFLPRQSPVRRSCDAPRR